MRSSQHSTEDVVPALKKYWMRHGYMPTFRELQNLLECNSTETVRKYLLKAEEEGLIRIARDLRGNMVTRAIYIVGMKVRFPQ